MDLRGNFLIFRFIQFNQNASNIKMGEDKDGMNIILDTPLPSSVISKRSYDNKILLIFLALMVFLIITGLLLLDVSSSETKSQRPYQIITNSGS